MNKDKEEAYRKWNKILFNDLVKPRLRREYRRDRRACQQQSMASQRYEQDKQVRLERHKRFIEANGS